MYQLNSQQMPYRKFILNVLISFFSDAVVWVQAGMIILVNFKFTGSDLESGIKMYALIIGALYTTYKLYKDVINEFRWWKAFKQWQSSKWSAGYYLLVKAILDVKRQLEKRKND